MRFDPRANRGPRRIQRTAQRKTTNRDFFQALEARYLMASVPVATGVPELSSNPSSTAKLYLDFNGAAAHTWQSFQVPTTPAYGRDSDPTTFNNTGDSNLHEEIDNIREIWARVAEKFSPFNVDVTTVDPGTYGDKQALRVIVGGDGSWLTTGGWSGAVSDGAFYNSGSNTVYVFSENFAGAVNYVADTIGQIAGRGFGLQLQSSYDPVTTLKTTWYNPGNGEIAPTMGAPTTSERGLWWYGTSSSAKYDFDTRKYTPVMQDDLALLSGASNGFGYRADDHGGSTGAATSLGSSGTVVRSGVIESVNDADYFSFTTAGGAVTINGNVAPHGAMLDLKFTVFNSSGSVVATSDSSSLSESLTTNLAAGTYFVGVSGHGWTDAYNNGVYVGKGADLGQYTLKVTLPAEGTTSNPPAAPSTLTASAASTSQINLAWSNVANESGYRIERSTDGVSWSQIATTPADVTTYQNTGLSAGTSYRYRVSAYNAAGESADSPIATAITQSPVVVAPAAPGTLSATAISQSSISLSWQNVAGETGYKIERSTDGVSWAQIATTGADATTFQNSGLSDSTLYSYRVRAYNSGGHSNYSPIDSATTAAAPALPPASPTGVTATAISTSRIDLAWNNVAGESGYRIERSLNGTSWGAIATLASDVTSFQNTGLEASTRYYYRVVAFNAGGSSQPSTMASALTSSAPTPTPVETIPAAPTNLSAQPGSGRSIELSWNDNSNNEDGFIIQINVRGRWENVATVSAGTTSYKHNGVKRKGDYIYRIAAFNSAGQSAFNTTG